MDVTTKAPKKYKWDNFFEKNQQKENTIKILGNKMLLQCFENHQIIHLTYIIEIFNTLEILEYIQIQNFSNNINLRKQDFLSQEKISHRSCFVNIDVSQS